MLAVLLKLVLTCANVHGDIFHMRACLPCWSLFLLTFSAMQLKGVASCMHI
jgi:hypothetical protein